MKTVVVFGLKNQLGGIESYLLSLQKQLKDVCRMTFLVESDGSALIHREAVEENGGEILPIPLPHPMGGYVRAMDQLLGQLRRETDLLYVNVGDLTMNLLAVLLLGRRHRYQLLTHSHSAREEVSLPGLPARLRHGVIKVWARKLLRGGKVRRLAITKASGDFHYGKASYEILPPGIDTLRFRWNEEARQKIRQQYDLAQDTRLLGFVGRLVQVKNPTYLLHILELVRRKEPNTKLMIVGDGPLKRQLGVEARERGLSDCVVFTGATSQVWEYVQAFDVMLSPSFSEGLGLMVIEAQAAGVPVICAREGFPPEVAVTDLLDMVSLEDSREWTRLAVEKMHLATHRRRGYHELLFASVFNEQVTAEHFAKILEEIR